MLLVICAFLFAVSLFAGSAPIVKSVAIRGADLDVALATQVGAPYDKQAIERDVRHLWTLGRFDEIRAEVTDDADGTNVIFQIVPSPQIRLHEIRIEPNSFGLQPKIPAGSMVDEREAHRIAEEARKQLQERGYLDPKVGYSFVRVPGNQVDLRLDVQAGPSARVRGVVFQGDPGLPEKELRRELEALRSRRFLPGVPHIWGGWRSFADYSQEAIDYDLARLRSLYLLNGYFQATVTAGEPQFHGEDARLAITIHSGPRYPFDGAGVCTDLLAQRRAAERQGVLDFSPRLHVELSNNAADVTTSIERGRPYRLGILEFTGNRHFSDALVRHNFLIDEGDPLDQQSLRKSIARLNRTQFFEPVGMSDLKVERNANSGLADITVHLTERKPGSWNFSGPVGPVSVGGPLQGALSSRLPSWGRGLFELSSYTASLSLLAFVHPIVPVTGLLNKRFLPLLMIRRPFLPGEGWKSGFLIAPQLGWQGMAINYGTTQLQARLLGLLEGSRAYTPDLPVTVEGPGGEGMMLCEAPKPRMQTLRKAASMAIRFTGALGVL